MRHCGDAAQHSLRQSNSEGVWGRGERSEINEEQFCFCINIHVILTILFQFVPFRIISYQCILFFIINMSRKYCAILKLFNVVITNVFPVVPNKKVVFRINCINIKFRAIVVHPHLCWGASM